MSRTSRLSLPTGLALLATLIVLGTVATSPALAASGRSIGLQGIYPLNAQPYGRSWGDWTATWWQWALSMPVSSHPLFDTADCSAGQSGPVWFLGGAFTGIAATRSCTVPAGISLFFPLLNSECSTVEPPPFYGADEAEMRACAAGWVDSGSDLFCIIDGVAVENVSSYRVDSPLFSFTAPNDNIFGIPGPVTGESVSDGYWIFLAPLSAGQHTIRFGGSFPGFPIDVTYELTVRPGGRGRGQVAGDAGTWGMVKRLYR